MKRRRRKQSARVKGRSHAISVAGRLFGFAQFEIALALSQRRPWPVWVVRSPEGGIEVARPATRSRILGISEEPDGSCRVGFAFIPTVKLLRPDHPDFERLKETLIAAATTR